MRTPLLLVLLLAVPVSACAQAQPDASPTPLPELAIEPSPISTIPPPAGTVSVAPREATPAPTSPASPTSGGAEEGTNPPRPSRTSAPPAATEAQPSESRSFTTFLTVDDASGDEGLEAPAYADLRRVTWQDDGERLRVWVDVGEELPTRLNEGEVIGLGIDLYPEGADEDGYQLFVDGGSDGWYAYFQTPRGFVAYPGSFAIGGRRLEFVVPWSSMGTPPRGQAKVFLDWSQARPIINAAGSDYAPEEGTRDWNR